MRKFLMWLKEQIEKDQHKYYMDCTPFPVEGEPKWVTRTHMLQEFDFRTGKRNDGQIFWAKAGDKDA